MPRSLGARVMFACVLLSGCYRSHERSRADAAVVPSPDRPTVEPCATVPAAACTAWEGAGPLTTLSEAVPSTNKMRYGYGIVRDCGALAAWAVVTSRGAVTSVSYETRTADWSGAPVGAIEVHPALTDDDASAAGPRIARGAGGAGGLFTSASSCVFAPLELDGRDRGPPLPQPTRDTCAGLAGSASGYSFLVRDSASGELALLTTDGAGSMQSRVPLDIPPERIFQSRIVFEDRSFLASASLRDFVRSRYTTWLRHFDESGRALAPEVEFANTSRVLVSATARGALAVWTTVGPGGIPLRFRPIERDGRPAGETREVPTDGSIYDVAIEPTPDGGAVLVWVEWHTDAADGWRLRVLALDPSGAPRGAPTTAWAGMPAVRALQILVEPQGSRALVLFDDEVSVRAQPLRCVR